MVCAFGVLIWCVPVVSSVVFFKFRIGIVNVWLLFIDVAVF